MELVDILTRDNIILNLQGNNQKEVIDELIHKLTERRLTTDPERFKKAIYKRENEISTAVGYGVAIPHAQCKSITKPTIIMGRSLQGVDYGGQHTNLIFMIAAPENAPNEHLSLLSKLSTFLMSETFRAKLIVATSEIDVIKAIQEQEKLEKPALNDESASGKYVVGITACMTGIAHTYMAAESLKEAARKRGMNVKIQTNGANGPENKLTPADIQHADAIVIAHDVRVDTSILRGKRFVDVPVKKAINHADELIDQALSYNIKDSSVTEQEIIEEPQTEEKSGLNFYKHIMSGVSYMIPFVVVGGIFIAISFMFGIYAADPESDQYNIIAHFFSQVGGEAAFALMIPILAGFIGFSIADKQGLAPAMIGGMMASIGGSGFLGGMIAGFVGGFAAKFVGKSMAKIPKSFQGLVSILVVPLISTFIVGAFMFFILNTPMSLLNEFLEGWLKGLTGINAAILGALLAGMMASDMGGPINKTASAFGLAMFAANIFEPSAALMVGGMVPPIGIALATTIFKNRFTLQEVEAGKASYVLGASFITEGAIPFAAADPLRIIPANIIGAAVGGAVCMAMDISLKAPHGGIFVIPIASNKPLLYIGCILLGSLITCFIIGFLKKPLSDKDRNSAKQMMNVI
ncbi:PTS fructose transporter subunit IIABC [Virgibacillus pantothenticus]|uniref:PTS fructose transporter subunit IIABC n=1 Tax=Virgibacillus pantothenticus TaxID=1473 RepID=UPI001AFD177A|nr:fructose-specific PTS transporter subunit EIIC [Virgibacillus pantothenticus]MBU8568354.1 fructose-specific PTS transporter subunit EIIC [Virgibacillus pantothenticus]MBU8602373.1 fructose-specific PTS transporter subunit EIIC [Virgibacillus pantothenticus]MBU8636508.1 fructose-specific PTS transporter subunit EIIC [Virgibacillus pantothenticus]MBU8642001.1 fructose-specific PTS transporter subunit EIIC [Virgibacillus pantothenticus]MBU8645785.1 fructose-specific PTS transporter subunit EII